ncbi:MAG: hypothetical protein FJ265_08925 [Planctomycetes bacterium]|nr:hypothetical protein [Planctomycetota bacterium]
MTSTLLLSTFLLFGAQDPPPAPGGAAPALDIVELRNGDRLEGRITTCLDGYVEIRLDAGTTVGVGMAQVARVRRGAGGMLPGRAPALRPRSEWFVLHDGNGASVGWLHAAVVVAADGAVQINEEYEFVIGRRRYQVTSLCRADAQLRPVTGYFRERIGEPVLGVALLAPGADGAGDRIVQERIVEATCRGDELHLARLDRSGRSERTLGGAAGATFPLLARELARLPGGALGPVTVFDPVSGELAVRRFLPPRARRVPGDGTAQQVTEITEASAAGRNSEWVDAHQRTLRRELAGPTLVAVPSSEGSARAVVGAARIPGALLREKGGDFGLWVPNPAWRVVDGQPAGQLALACDVHGASIGLARLDHLPGASLDTAAQAVANWFHLLHPGLGIGSRTAATVRDRPALRLEAGGPAAAARATIDVIPHRGAFLVLVCRAPAAAWEELEPDFAFVRASVELDARGLAPELQGPLAETGRRRGG